MKSIADFSTYKISEIGCTEENISDITFLANKPISELCSGNTNLLVFPDEIDYYGEEIGMKSICHLSSTNLTTGDVVGFVGYNNTSLTIRSRFSLDGKNDNFLHYMLKKVFAVNFFDLQHTVSDEKVFELYICLFPYLLKRALRQGVYKQYQNHWYNDSNIRGKIDIPRYIRQNIPFNGKVSYICREYVYDNDVTQLIRHTIEFIKKHPLGEKILKDKETGEFVSLITNLTPSYSSKAISGVVARNLRPLHHPYFTHYNKLQRLCLQILRRGKMKYGIGDNKVYGLLFSGSWLWEEYIGLLLKDKYTHCYRSKGMRYYLFENPCRQRIIPDYIMWNPDGKTAKIIADAKYVKLNVGDIYTETKATGIYYKTITYMFRFGVNKGLLFYPSADGELKTEMKIQNTESCIIKLPLKIPFGDYSFENFCELMELSENEFKKTVNGIDII